MENANVEIIYTNHMILINFARYLLWEFILSIMHRWVFLFELMLTMAKYGRVPIFMLNLTRH